MFSYLLLLHTFSVRGSCTSLFLLLVFSTLVKTYFLLLFTLLISEPPNEENTFIFSFCFSPDF